MTDLEAARHKAGAHMRLSGLEAVLLETEIRQQAACIEEAKVRSEKVTELLLRFVPATAMAEAMATMRKLMDEDFEPDAG